MDGSGAIERNRAALVRIVASLAAMAGFTSPLAGEDGSARRGKAEPSAEPGEGDLSGVRPTIPRHLWVAMLRLLRPAEAAARRLIIAAARGLVVPPPSPPKTTPKPADPAPFQRRFGLAVMASPARIAQAAAAARRARAQGADATRPAAARAFSLPLLDPLRNPLRPSGHARHARAVPRILFPGLIEPFRIPPPPSPDDPVSAAGVARRIAALAAALDDLPRQARRFARLKARMDAQAVQYRAVAGASEAGGSAPPSARRRFRRTSPLRGGPPYAGRLAVWDPTVPHGKHIREVDVILAHVHALADYALAFPDTS